MFNKFLSFIYINIFKFFPVKINLFFAKFFKKLHDLHTQSSYSKDFKANLEVEGNKFKLLLKKNDSQAQGVYQKLHFNNDGYETIMVKTLIKTIEILKTKNFLDLGSFMGFYSCLIASKFRDDQNIYAIESNPKYVSYINKSIKLNNFLNINVINKILSDREEELYVQNEKVLSSSKNNKNLEKLKAITLDKLCKEKKIYPEVIKIDVHGAEGKVLSGSSQILEKYAKVIFLELHSSEYLKKYSNGLTRKKIITSLIEKNFDCFLVSSFRDYSKKERNYEFMQIKNENFDFVFFDRDNLDQFILCVKNNIDKKFLELFK